MPPDADLLYAYNKSVEAEATAQLLHRASKLIIDLTTIKGWQNY